jgi:UDP-N-acetylmuramyl pentapeptide phosphotransferase/UDP-N-acetylglucosamine-1-phosphate transferase
MTLHLAFSSISVIAISFIFSLIMTLRVRSLLVKRAILDQPNARSSHTVPVPRGGGWGVLSVLIAGMLITAFKQHSFVLHSELMLGVVILAFVSWRDDHKGVSPVKRLGVHLLAAFLGSLCFAHDQTLFGTILPFWLDRAIMIIGWALFMNFYNFMDGIDGITGVETIALAGGSCLVMTLTGLNDPFLSVLTSLLTGVCLGFLALNWHPAKIFLGDVGSVPLGYLTGFALLTLAINGYPAPALILPAYYLADSGVTLIKRALKREKIWQAHRQHFYQRATLALKRHDKVVYAIIIANITLIGLSLYAVTHPLRALSAAAIVVVLLLGWMHRTGVTSDA